MFLIAGGIAAIVNFGSRFYLNIYVSYSTAIVLAYMVGMMTAYLISRRYVFPAGKHSIARSAFYFLIVNLFAILQTWLVSIGLRSYLEESMNLRRHAPDIAHAVGIMVPVFTSYIGHKYLTFRRPD